MLSDDCCSNLDLASLVFFLPLSFCLTFQPSPSLISPCLIWHILPVVTCHIDSLTVSLLVPLSHLTHIFLSVISLLELLFPLVSLSHLLISSSCLPVSPNSHVPSRCLPISPIVSPFPPCLICCIHPAVSLSHMLFPSCCLPVLPVVSLSHLLYHSCCIPVVSLLPP